MNPQPDRDLDLRLQQLEAELSQTPPSPPTITQPEKPLQPQTDSSRTLHSQLNRFINWFNGLPGLGRLLAIGFLAIVGFAILRAVLQLVAAVISLAVLAVLLYFVYQFFLARSAETKD
jgi:hypothetical protein